MTRMKRAIGGLVTARKVVACMLESPQGKCCQAKRTTHGEVTICARRSRTKNQKAFGETVHVEVKTRTPEYGGLGVTWKRKADSPESAINAIDGLYPTALHESNLIGHREWLYRKYGYGELSPKILDAVEKIEARTGRSALFADMSYADVKFWDRKLGRLTEKFGAKR